jgi:transcriptional regulator with GAF, ATPase, and Fis domain
VFFDVMTPDLCASVGEASRRGIERVLAVATTDRSSHDDPWRLVALGASDVLNWWSRAEPAAEIAARLTRWHEVDELVRSPLVSNTLVGESPAWIGLLREIVEVARFSDSSTLISGESGTGKELVAKLTHGLDARPTKRELVVLDCTTVVPTLSGSEFFGHERGAFTGAVGHREGAFELADGGTLFLDEVGELTTELQAELLRVIQEGTFKRIGSNTWRETRFRLICATNRNLLEEESHGRFRRDFYYRIASWACHLPPLRERRDDIPLLTRHFVAEFLSNTPDVEVDVAVMDLLRKRDYPGNVRDLRQLVGRICTRHVGFGPITVGDVPPEERPALEPEVRSRRVADLDAVVRDAIAEGIPLADLVEEARGAAVRIALQLEGGSTRRAAQRLSVTTRAIQLHRARHRGERGDRIVEAAVVVPEVERTSG